MAKPTYLALRLTFLILLATLFSACNNQTAPSSADAEATIAALSTANAEIQAQLNELSAALGTPAPTAQASDGTEAEAAVTESAVTESAVTESAVVEAAKPAAPLPVMAASEAVPGGLLPRLDATLALAPEGATLSDLRFDPSANRLYVTDTTERLHVVDGETLAVLATLSIGGSLELDTRNGRLYAYRPFVLAGEAPVIHVIDTATLSEIGVIEGGAIAVDVERNRLFVGERFALGMAEDTPGVRVIDGATLQLIGEIAQPGAPVYNPARNEVLIVAYTVFSADGDTYQVTGDLFPELTDLEQVGFLGCNGCRWADNAWVLPEVGKVAVSISAHCAGKGCGQEEPPHWFDALTMAPVDPAIAPELRTGCGTAVDASEAVDGRFYRNRFYSRYMFYANLLVYDQSGAPITWRDGISIEFINTRTGQGYLYDGVVIDLATLLPIGRWPAACVLGYDAERGRIFGQREGQLYVIEERGGVATEATGSMPADLGDSWIVGIEVSPNFAVDSTLLAKSDTHALYRSTDGGASWMRLNGVPNDRYQTLYAFFSPNYAADSTLYVTGHRSDSWGYGVWRSQDGGDRWEPLWNNLVHLRGVEILFSQEFAEDQTMLLRSHFHDVLSGIDGASFQRSTDGGLSWTLVVTGGYSTSTGQVALPPVDELLPAGRYSAVADLRMDDYGTDVFYTANGSDWLTATINRRAGDLLLELLPSPAYTTDKTAYVVSNASVWRTLDGGVTWAQWEQDRFTDPNDFAQRIHSAAITPLLEDGSYWLYLGTGEGEILALDPTTITWLEADEPAVADDIPAQAAAVPTAVPEALTGDPPPDLFRPEGELGMFWENNVRAQQELGWAMTAQPTTGLAAVQRFDNGVMVWVEETGRIYAFINGGRWASYEDTFREGDPESDPAFAPPAGKQQPMRGFGKVWRTHRELRDAIGWALTKEEPVTALRQPFERGEILRAGVFVYTMIGNEEGSWY